MATLGYGDSALEGGAPDLPQTPNAFDESAVGKALRGYGRGLGKQASGSIAGLAEMGAHPIRTLSGIGSGLGIGAYNALHYDTSPKGWGGTTESVNPQGVLPSFLDAVASGVGSAKKAWNGAPGEFAELLGENIGPGKLARALRSAAISTMVIGPTGMRHLGIKGGEPGTWIGDHGKEVAEISDAGLANGGPVRTRLSSAQVPYPGTGQTIKSTLKETLDEHPELYAAYPGIEHTVVNHIYDPEARYGGQYTPIDGSITINHAQLMGNNNLDRLKGITLHEVQHKIQDLENYGSPFTGTSVENAGGFYPYYKDLGETEARLTDARKKWTPEQRAAAPFQDHVDMEQRRLDYNHTLMNPVVSDGDIARDSTDFHRMLATPYKDINTDPAAVARYLRRYNQTGPKESFVAKNPITGAEKVVKPGDKNVYGTNY
jgi:hypothetical protein